MSYLSLTLDQKRRIRAERDARKSRGEAAHIMAMAQWAKDTFKLPQLPGKATMSRLLSTVSLSPSPSPLMKTRKRQSSGTNANVERVLFTWITDCYNRRLSINGPIIRAKAHKLQEEFNSGVGDSLRTNLTFSEGWFAAFKRRWGIRTYRLHGESGDCDNAAVQSQLPDIISKLRGYSAKDTFNADEFGLNYKMAPTTTVAAAKLAGRKKEKERISVLACANAEGSEKFELMIIGKSRKPRAFKKRTGSELGFDYHANKKAWMTQTLFFEWLKRFDAYVARTQNRKVALLLDNCTAHGCPETLPELHNVEVIFLPPNTTSKIQPMDAGVIASVKARYRSAQMERAVDLIDEDLTNVYKVDILTAMRILKRIWESLPSGNIRHCWEHTGVSPNCVKKLAPRQDESPADRDAEVLQTQVARARDTSQRHRIDVDQLLNAPGELECTEELDSAQMLFETADGPDSDIDEDPVPHPLPPMKEQLKALSVAKRIMGDRGATFNAAIAALSRAQSDLRSEAAARAQQTSITDYFK